MEQPGPDPDDYPPIDPGEPVPDDPGELLPDTPDTLPPAPIEPMPRPDDPDVGVPAVLGPGQGRDRGDGPIAGTAHFDSGAPSYPGDTITGVRHQNRPRPPDPQR